MEEVNGDRRDDRHEPRAIFDLLPDLLIPRIAADEFVLVESDLDAGRAQRFGDPPCCLRVPRRVGQEDGFGWF